jgi:hypothetical protein
MNEEENIVRGQTAPREHLHCEKVHPCEHFHVGRMNSLQLVL